MFELLTTFDPTFECCFYDTPAGSRRANVCGIRIPLRAACHMHVLFEQKLSMEPTNDLWFWYPRGHTESRLEDLLYGVVRYV
jgi:hypothetical protein